MDLTDCRGFLLNHFHIIASLSFNLRFGWHRKLCSRTAISEPMLRGHWGHLVHLVHFHIGYPIQEISSDFHNLFMIFCNVDDEIFKFFEIVHWGTLFWNLKICLFLFINFFCRFLNHCQFSLLRNAASQRCSFLQPSMLLTCCLLT